jgi:hypothetical protein
MNKNFSFGNVTEGLRGGPKVKECSIKVYLRLRL